MAILVACIGILGNTAAIIYFGRNKYRTETFQALLISLAIADNVYLVIKIRDTGAIEYISTSFTSYVSDFPNYRLYTSSLHLFAVTGSIYFTVAISIERYLVIYHPFFRHVDDISAKVYVFPVITFSIVINIMLYLLYGTKN